MANLAIVTRRGTVYVDREDSRAIVTRGGTVYVNQSTVAGGLSIPIAAYHYNHNLKK